MVNVYEATARTNQKIAAKKAEKATPTIITDATVREETIPTIKSQVKEIESPYTANVIDQNFDENSKGYSNEMSSYYEGLINDLNNDPLYTQELKLLDAQSDNLDKDYRDTLSGLKEQFERRYQSLKTSQEQQSKGMENALLLGGANSAPGGSSRYAPISSSGIMSAKEKYDLETWKDLVAEENNLKREAIKARREGEYQIASAKLATLKEKRQEQRELSAKIQEEMIAENQAIREQQRISQRDTEIGNLLSKGISDPVEIMNSLNAQGGMYSAKEVDETLKALARDGDIDKLSGDTRDFFILKKMGALPGSITSLPEGQQMFEYIRQKGSAGRAPTGTGTGGGLFSGGGSVPGISDDASKALQLAVEGLKFGSVADKKSALETIGQLLLQGDVQSAKDQLGQYAYNSMSATQQDAQDGRYSLLSAIGSIESQLAEFEAAGGDTNIFQGLSEKALQKGGFTKDPELASIANNIALAIIDYRKSVSGAAFTESEKADYNAVFPSIGNTPALNSVKIQTLKDKAQRNVDRAIASRIGGEQRFNSIFNNPGAVTPAKTADVRIEEAVDSDPAVLDTIEQLYEENPALTDEELVQILGI